MVGEWFRRAGGDCGGWTRLEQECCGSLASMAMAMAATRGESGGRKGKKEATAGTVGSPRGSHQSSVAAMAFAAAKPVVAGMVSVEVLLAMPDVALLSRLGLG